MADARLFDAEPFPPSPGTSLPKIGMDEWYSRAHPSILVFLRDGTSLVPIGYPRITPLFLVLGV